MKIIIVDNDDKIIGSKERAEIKKEDIYRVAALWIKNSKNQFLLAKRALTKKNDPGKWGPAVAGTVEEGETYESNITKEAKEELGLKNLNLIKGSKTRTKGIHNHFTQWFLVTLDKTIEEFEIQEEEIDEIKWFTKKVFMKKYKENPSTFIPKIKKYVEMF